MCYIRWGIFASRFLLALNLMPITLRWDCNLCGNDFWGKLVLWAIPPLSSWYCHPTCLILYLTCLYFRSSGFFDRHEGVRSGYFSDRERSGYFSDREAHAHHKYGMRQQASVESADSRLCYLTSSEVRKFLFFVCLLWSFSEWVPKTWGKIIYRWTHWETLHIKRNKWIVWNFANLFYGIVHDLCRFMSILFAIY